MEWGWGREVEVCTHSSGSVLPQEALHVSSSHQLQQDETRQDVQAHADAADYVLMAEFAANQDTVVVNVVLSC